MNSLDCAITPLPQSNGALEQILLSSTDFFFPLIDDPYLQGIIACANVFSDLYALGATRIDSVLMILGITDCIESTTNRETIMKLLMAGFCEGAQRAGAYVGGGQTIRNRSPIIGGVASSVIPRESLIRNDSIRPGNILVLTKPLGTDYAVRSHVSSPSNNTFEAYETAVRSMAHLNLAAAQAMALSDVTGATDVTGFGLLGHAASLANVQKCQVSFRFFLLPLIAGTDRLIIDGKEILNSKLLSGSAAETSGGLLVALSNVSEAEKFIEAVEKIGGTKSWIVGKVEKKRNEAESAYIEHKITDNDLLSRYVNCGLRIVPASSSSSIGILDITTNMMFLKTCLDSPCEYDQIAIATRLRAEQ